MTWPAWLNDADGFLKVWAALGPFAGAAASAVWYRVTQKNDREFLAMREDSRLDRDAALKRDDHERQVRRADFEKSRAATGRLLTAAVVYIVKSQSKDVPDITEAFDEIAAAFNEVVALGPEDVSKAATALWRAAITFASQDDGEARTTKFWECHAAFARASDNQRSQKESGTS